MRNLAALSAIAIALAAAPRTHAAELKIGYVDSQKIFEGLPEAQEAKKKKAARRILNTTPSHKLEDYSGDYFNPGYGNLKVTLQQGQLSFLYNNITTPLEHWHYDTFNGRKAGDPVFEDSKLNFISDAKGNVAKGEIIVPTNQNQLNIEADLARMVQEAVDKAPSPEAIDKAAITHEMEKLVRAYDPCMSCAAHFMKVKWEFA